MSCSLGELKRLISAKSSRTGSHNSRDDYDLIISNANTNEGSSNSFFLLSKNFIFSL